MTTAVVLADDFTGAMDTGYGFAARSHPTRVFLCDPGDDLNYSGDGVVVIDTDTRNAAPAVAAETVATALRSADQDASTLIYKKIDSTLRGNVVVEVDAAINSIDVELAVVAPAFPSVGRITKHGRHIVEGVLLAEAGYQAETSKLARHFESSQYRVESLDLETIENGVLAIRTALESAVTGNDPVIVTCDAVTGSHLKAIARGVNELERRALLVGSGGLAAAVSIPSDSDRPSPSLPPRDERESRVERALAVVGSSNRRTFEQLAKVPDEFVYRLDSERAVCDPVGTGREARVPLENRLNAFGRCVLTAATEEADVDRAHRTAEALESTVSIDVGGCVATALGTAISETVTTSPTALFLTGGSVARAVLDALDATAIDVTGEAVEDGIPEGSIVDGRAAGTRVVTKAGGFGSKGSIINWLTAVGGLNEEHKLSDRRDHDG